MVSICLCILHAYICSWPIVILVVGTILWTYPDKTRRKWLYEVLFLLEACGLLDTELLSFGWVLPIIWKSLCISSQQVLWSLPRGSSEGHVGLRCHGEIKLARQLSRVPNYCLSYTPTQLRLWLVPKGPTAASLSQGCSMWRRSQRLSSREEKCYI